MNTLLLFPRENGSIDAIDEREYDYQAMLELRDYIQGRFVTLGDTEMEYLDNCPIEEVGRILDEKYRDRI